MPLKQQFSSSNSSNHPLSKFHAQHTSKIVLLMDYFMYKELYEPTNLNIKMISKSIIDDKMFVVFDFPNGSTMSLNGQRLNAVRGSLCFVREDVVFMLTRQSTESLSRNRAYNNIEAIKAKLFHDFEGFEYKPSK